MKLNWNFQRVSSGGGGGVSKNLFQWGRYGY